MDLIVCQYTITITIMTGSNRSEQQGWSSNGYKNETLQGQITLSVGKGVQVWAQYLLHFASLMTVVIQARSFQKLGYNQRQHRLWKRVTSVNSLQHCHLSAYAEYQRNILWSSARTWLFLTIQLHGLHFSQQFIYITTYWGSCVQKKLVTIYINKRKSGASTGIAYECTLLLLSPKQH